MLAMLGVAGGLVLLMAGGTALVRGACQLAAALHISPLIVGLTVVAFGTSAPELFVNLIGALNGQEALAFGNVIGSNIANLALVLGAAALISPIALQGGIVLREVPLYLLGSATLLVMVNDRLLEGAPDVISRGDALNLLLLFAVFVYLTARNLLRERDEGLVTEVEETALVPAPGASWWGLPSIVLGVALLFLGGKTTVNNAVLLADQFGIDENVVGLLVIAVGTSLPELVTSIVAAMRGESDLCLGNVVGSSLFNVLFVLPLAGVVTPIPVPPGGTLDVTVAFALGLLLVPLFLVNGGRLGRTSGVALLALYATYALWRLAGA